MPNLSRLDEYRPKQVTRILDRNNVPIGELGSEKRTVVPYSSIPKLFVQAVVAAEDADYFKHGGVDYMGMARAFITNVLRGRTAQGGSTITQQVIKNLLLTPERSMKRKVQEIILAHRLQREAVEGGRARALPEPDLLRPWPLRLRGGGALLLRQVGEGDRSRRGGAAGRAAAEPGAAVAAQAPRRGQGAPALRARADGRPRLHRAQGGGADRGPADPAGARDRRRRAAWPPRRSTSSRTLLSDKLGESAAYEVGTTVTTTLDAKLQELARVVGRARASRISTRARASAARRVT